MDDAQGRRLGFWAQLLARPATLDHAAWALVAHKAESSLSPFAAILSLWARATVFQAASALGDMGAIPQGAFAAADFFRQPIPRKDAESAVADRRARARPAAASPSVSGDAQPVFSTPWELLAFLARKAPQSLEFALNLTERADAAAGLDNPYLRVIAWDNLARLLALDILLARDRSAGALRALAISLRRDISSPASLAADVLHPLLQGDIPVFHDDLAMGSAALGLLEKLLGRPIRFADPRWAAFRDGRIFDEKENHGAATPARASAFASFSALGSASFARGRKSVLPPSGKAVDALPADDAMPAPILAPAALGSEASEGAASRENSIASEAGR